MKKEVGDDANILCGCFVFTIMKKDTDNKIFKAQLVVQGHLDREKDILLHASTTVHEQANVLLVSLATICSFKL